MKLLNKDKNIFEVKIESLDDLYHLSLILGEGNIIFEKSKRKIKTNDKIITKVFNFEIETLKITLRNLDLRIQGKILNETQFTSIGQSHSLIFEEGDILKFEKNYFTSFEKKLFDKIVKEVQNKNLLLIFDKTDLLIVEFSNYSYKILIKENNFGSKKGNLEDVNENEKNF